MGLGIPIGHAAVYVGYYQFMIDGQYRHMVIQASNPGYYIDYRPFDYTADSPTFMGSDPISDYTKSGLGPRNRCSHGTWDGSGNTMMLARRNAIITEAVRLVGAGVAYPSVLPWPDLWDNGLNSPNSLNPRSTPIGTPTAMRCDGLVEWVYEKVGFNTCNNVGSFTYWSAQTPDYHAADWMAASVDAPSTTPQDNGATCTITTDDPSSQPTYVTVAYPDGTIGFYASPATITKRVGTTFYWGSDFAGHQGGGNWFDYSPQGQPDLTIVGQVGVSPTSVAQGGTIQVSWTEKNQGTAASAPAHHTKISLATSAYGTTYQVAYFGPMSTLGVGVSQNHLQSIVVPASIPAGTYYVTAFIDCDGQVTESNEGNNIGSSTPAGLTVTVSQTAPLKAINPSPGNNATGQSINTTPSWANGGGATSYDVYFNGQYKGNQATTSYSPGTLAYSTAYSWRIDARNSVGVTTGDAWSFTTEAAPQQAPSKATNPTPANASTGQSISTMLYWANGGGAASYDVYFNGQYKGNQTATSYSPGTLANSTAYSWRIDARNSVGVTTGDTWSFTTGAAGAAPTITGISPASGSTSGGTVVTITGTNFDIYHPFTVYFGATWAIMSGASESQIIVSSPAEAAGTVDITVVMAGGTSQTSPADRFTYMEGTIPTNTGSPAMVVEGWYGGSAETIFNGVGGPDWGHGTYFGTVTQNSTPPTRTYTVTNSGTAPLILGAPTMPSGVTIIESLNATIPAGGSDDFTVQMSTANGGTISGNISFTNNAAESPFSFAIAGTVSFASPATTITTINASPSSVAYGQPVNLTANVALLPDGSATPNGGTVTFLDDGTVLGMAPVTGGIATVSTTALPAGLQKVTAIYSGYSSQFPGSSSSMINTIARSQQVGEASDIAIDASGNVFIAGTGNNCVYELNASSGTITTIAGNGTPGYNGDNIQATAASLNGPRGVALDGSGHLFIADTGNCRIREVDLSTGLINTVVGNGTPGFSGDGGLAVLAEIKYPTRIALDNAGNVFIADTYNARIREYIASTKTIQTVAGSGTAYGNLGDGGPPLAASLDSPMGVAVDSNGNIFIADYNGNRIRKVNTSANIITTVAGNGNAVWIGDNIQATAASFNYPTDVALDNKGDLFFAASGSLRVCKVDLSSGILTTAIGNGYCGYSDGGSPLGAQVWSVDGIAVTGDGDLFIADQNPGVRQVSASISVQVTPSILTVKADNKTRIYGDIDPSFTAAITGFQNGDTLETSSITGNPSLTSGGTVTSPVGNCTISASLGTLAAPNYNFQFTNGTLSITPASLLVAADNKSRLYGDTNPTFTASYTGFKNGETLASSGVSGNPLLTCSATSNNPAGNYAIAVTTGTLAAQNYNFIFLNGTLNVNPATLTVTADNKNRVYGDPNPTFSASYTGFMNGETLATSGISGSPSLTCTATTTSPTGDYTIVAGPGTLAAQNYNFDLFNGTLTVISMQISDTNFGVQTNQFGFTITGTSNLVIVVEACTNLVNAVWIPLATNTLTGGSSYFSDPKWTNYPWRFYRLRTP